MQVRRCFLLGDDPVSWFPYCRSPESGPFDSLGALRALRTTGIEGLRCGRARPGREQRRIETRAKIFFVMRRSLIEAGNRTTPGASPGVSRHCLPQRYLKLEIWNSILSRVKSLENGSARPSVWRALSPASRGPWPIRVPAIVIGSGKC